MLPESCTGVHDDCLLPLDLVWAAIQAFHLGRLSQRSPASLLQALFVFHIL
jgi:hypothetical protein